MIVPLSWFGGAIAWASWGVLAGVLCDKSTWTSPEFLAAAASTAFALSGKDLQGSIIPSLLCATTFAIGSRVRIIGLTGGIAVGKSSVEMTPSVFLKEWQSKESRSHCDEIGPCARRSARLRELHVPVIDADQIAHSVLEKGKPAYQRVVKAFRGYPGVISDQGDINRSELRKLVFADKSLNRKLKSCTHSAIAIEMLCQIMLLSLWRGHPLVVLDAPLLFESKSNLLCKHVIAVHCNDKTQFARLARRDGCTEQECANAVASQMPQEAKIRRSDIPISNDGTLEELRSQVDSVCRTLLHKANRHVTRLCGLGTRFQMPT